MVNMGVLRQINKMGGISVVVLVGLWCLFGAIGCF